MVADLLGANECLRLGDAKGQVKRYKTRLVAKGYSQREGIDFKENLSLVSTKDSLRIIMAIVAYFDLELH